MGLWKVCNFVPKVLDIYFSTFEQFRVPGNSIVLSPELYITVLAYTSILNPEVPQVCVKSVGTGTFYSTQVSVYVVWFVEFM